jgi:hypothetical protein
VCIDIGDKIAANIAACRRYKKLSKHWTSLAGLLESCENQRVKAGRRMKPRRNVPGSLLTGLASRTSSPPVAMASGIELCQTVYLLLRPLL